MSARDRTGVPPEPPEEQRRWAALHSYAEGLRRDLFLLLEAWDPDAGRYPVQEVAQGIRELRGNYQRARWELDRREEARQDEVMLSQCLMDLLGAPGERLSWANFTQIEKRARADQEELERLRAKPRVWGDAEPEELVPRVQALIEDPNTVTPRRLHEDGTPAESPARQAARAVVELLRAPRR